MLSMFDGFNTRVYYMKEFQVTTALKKLNAMKTRVKVVQGGTWGGKTFNIVPLIINKCIHSKGEEFTVTAKSIPALKKGALKDFISIMTMTGRWVNDRYNRTDRKYTFANGSYIEFASFETVGDARAAGKRTGLFMNEADGIPFEIAHALMERTTGDIWMDFNPVNRFWAHTQVLPNKNASLLILNYLDNEALPKSVLDSLMQARDKAKAGSSYWRNYWNVYGLGQIGNLEGACIKNWEQIDKLPREARLLCYGMDFGYTNDPTTLIGLYKYNNEYIFHELIYKTRLLNVDISTELRKLGIDDMDIIYADSAEPKSIAELRTYKHMVEPCTKGKDSIVHGINLIGQQERVFITASSINLIGELQSYVWMKNKEGESINKPIGGNDHCIDAMRYALSSYLSNPNKGEYHIH